MCHPRTLRFNQKGGRWFTSGFMNKETSYFYFTAWLIELSLALGVTAEATFLAFSSEKKLTEIERFVCEDGVSRFTLLIGAFRELSAELGRRVKRIIQTGSQQEQSIKYKESRNSWQKPQKLILVPPTGAKWPLFQKLEI